MRSLLVPTPLRDRGLSLRALCIGALPRSLSPLRSILEPLCSLIEELERILLRSRGVLLSGVLTDEWRSLRGVFIVADGRSLLRLERLLLYEVDPLRLELFDEERIDDELLRLDELEALLRDEENPPPPRELDEEEL